MENLFRRETEALRIIEKEIVQLVWADQILRSLLNFALVRRRQKLGGNGRCENVGQNFANLSADARGFVPMYRTSVFGTPAFTPYIDI